MGLQRPRVQGVEGEGGPNEAVPFGTGKRFEGYGYFNQHPEALLAFLERQLG